VVYEGQTPQDAFCSSQQRLWRVSAITVSDALSIHRQPGPFVTSDGHRNLVDTCETTCFQPAPPRDHARTPTLFSTVAVGRTSGFFGEICEEKRKTFA